MLNLNYNYIYLNVTRKYIGEICGLLKKLLVTEYLIFLINC